MGNKFFTPRDFRVDFLSDDEFNMVNQFRSLKKQVEWISGRFLIKHLTRHYERQTQTLCDIKVKYLDYDWSLNRVS